MPIRAQSADGTIHEFPDGTDQAVVDRVMKQFATAAKPEPDSFLSRLGHGFMDPIYGGAQVGARMSEPGEEIGAAIFGVDLEKQKAERQQTVDKAVQERERKYNAPEGIDWARGMGAMVNPVVAAPAALGGIPGALAAGAMSGLTQPVNDPEHFGAEKAKQVGIGTAVGGVFGAAGKAVGKGIEAFGSYLAREYPENVMTQAVQKILKRMGQDQAAGGPSAQDAIDLINAAAARGKPVTLADVGGENIQGLAGNVARQPGEGRNITTQFLNARDEGAAARLQNDIRQYVSGGPSMVQTTEALLNARSAASRPAYDAMRAMDGIWSERLQQFIDEPLVKSGMARGYEIERLQALAEGRPFDPTQMGVNLDAEGNIQLLRTPNMRVLDMAKQGLDAMVAAERNEITGRLSARGVALDRVREAYVAELDSLDRNGLYRAARAAWAGPSASLDALRLGRSVFQNSPEQNAAAFGRLTEGDQEFARLGVADMLRERLARTGLSGDEAKSIVKNPWMRDQLRPFFRSDEDFSRFVDAVATETKMFNTRYGVLGNSRTAARLAEDESAENLGAAEGANIAHQIATGRWAKAAHTAVRLWRDRQDRRGNDKLNEQVARILFQTPIEADSEIAQRLTGTFTGPASVNRLEGAAAVAPQVGTALAPGAASVLAPATPLPPNQPPMPGARQAPDGQWYVPDPARPGKYQRVVD